MSTHTTVNKSYTPEASRALEYFEAKNAFSTGPVEVSYMLRETDKPFTIVDVRAEEDYRQGHLPGAVNLPKDRWEDPQGKGISKDKKLVLYCYNIVCHLASKAAAELAGQGYDVMEMAGGFETWQQKQLPVER